MLPILCGLTTAGVSFIKAQDRATTQPRIVQPRKKLRARTDAKFRLFLATMAGAKYVK
jgi:hypothetical protein